MRLATGVTDQYIYFVAIDSTDHVSRKTGLATFTVYRSRNGGAATAYTTPTVTEVSAANMPGVYKFLVDEDMTIDSGDDTQEICYHITATGMDPVTRVIELFRQVVTSGNQLLVDANGRVDVIKVAGTTQTAGDIPAKTNSLAFTGANKVDASVRDWIGEAIPATNVTGVPKVDLVDLLGSVNAVTALSRWLNFPGATGTADSGTTTTMVDAALTQGDVDYWKGAVIIFNSGTIAGQARVITAFDPATDTVTFAPALTQAVATQNYAIINFGALAAGAAMALTTAERTAIANEVEAQIIDETDSEKVLTAITDKIASVNPSLSGLTLAAIATQVRTELATELGRIDVAISTRLAAAGYTAPDNADIAAILVALGDVPTNAELATAFNTARDEANGVEVGLTERQFRRLVAAALFGKVSGLNLGTPAFRDVNDTVDRIAATTDVNGNRSAVVLTP